MCRERLISKRVYRLRNGGDDGNNDADDEFRNDIGRLIDERIYYRGLSLRRIVREEYDSGQECEKQSTKPADDDSGNDALFK